MKLIISVKFLEKEICQVRKKKNSGEKSGCVAESKDDKKKMAKSSQSFS